MIKAFLIQLLLVVLLAVFLGLIDVGRHKAELDRDPDYIPIVIPRF